jgi:hypothetical protein
MYTLADLLEEINWRNLVLRMTPTGFTIEGPEPSVTPEILAACRYYSGYIYTLLELRWHWRSNTNR